MKYAISASFLIALFAIAASGQTPSQCPTIRESSLDSAESGQQITYTVTLTGGDDDVSPTYNWSVCAGNYQCRAGKFYDNGRHRRLVRYLGNGRL